MVATKLKRNLQSMTWFIEMVQSVFAALNLPILAVGPPAAVNKLQRKQL
jgi:hypothetical protein